VKNKQINKNAPGWSWRLTSLCGLLCAGMNLSAQAAVDRASQPLNQAGGFHTNTGYSINLVRTTDASDPSYDWLTQVLHRVRVSNHYGTSFGLSTSLTINSLSLSSLSASGYRYRGFDSLAGTVSGFVDLGRLFKLPLNALVELGGGAALAMYPETYMLFYLPVFETALRVYYRPIESLPNLALGVSLELPVLFPAGGISVGGGLGVYIVFLPAAPASGPKVLP